MTLPTPSALPLPEIESKLRTLTSPYTSPLLQSDSLLPSIPHDNVNQDDLQHGGINAHPGSGTRRCCCGRSECAVAVANIKEVEKLEGELRLAGG